MKNIELQAMLKNYPDECDINIHVDAETSELVLTDVHIDHVPKDNLIVIVMGVENPWANQNTTQL